MTRPLVLLDRDGVINEDITPHGTLNLEAFRYLDGALDAIATLHRAGFAMAIVTNQSAVAKGLLSEATLHAIHEKLLRDVRTHGGDVDAIYVCTDHPDTPSHRRKPNSGMLEEALADFGVLAANTPMVGDAQRDMQAAHSLGCPRILVETGKGKATIEKNLIQDLQPVTICANLPDAVAHIIRHYQA